MSKIIKIISWNVNGIRAAQKKGFNDFIEKENGEFSICCYEDPQISKSSDHIGLFRTGMIQSGGYEQAKPMIEEKSPLLQIAYAADVRDMTTYEQISRLVPMRKCRIISEKDLKKQEYYFERTANIEKKSDEDSKK